MNLLKAYHERDPRFVTCVLREPVTVGHETVPDETKANPTVFDALPELLPEEQAELKAILTEFTDLFSDKPRKITLGVHHIELLPNTQPIRSAPYRLHPEKDVFFRKEFKNSAHISSVLSDLLQSRSRFEWTKEADAAYLDLTSPSGYTTARPPASLLTLLTHRERGTFSCPRCSLPYPCAKRVVTVYSDHNPLVFLQRMANHNQKLLPGV